MFKSLLHSLFGSFFRTEYKLSEEDRSEVLRMIAQANAIAEGDYVTSSTLPEPVIPKRRSKPRK